MTAKKKAETIDQYRNLVENLRARLDDLSLAAVLHDRHLRELSTEIAWDWVLETGGSLDDYEQHRFALAQESKSLRHAFCVFAQAIEADFTQPDIIRALSRAPNLLLCVFSERAACSNLCSPTILRRQMYVDAEASFAAGPIPTADEIDKIIAHGTKLVTLLNQGQEIK